MVIGLSYIDNNSWSKPAHSGCFATRIIMLAGSSLAIYV